MSLLPPPPPPPHKVLYGEVAPRGPSPYTLLTLFVYHFDRKATPFMYLLLKNTTTFTYLLKQKLEIVAVVLKSVAQGGCSAVCLFVC